MENDSPGEFATVPEAAKMFRSKRKTFDNWRAQGRGPAYVKIGSRVLYPIEDLKAFIAANRVEPAA